MDTEESLWAEWNERYGTVRDQLTRDGAGPSYFTSRPRVLVVLKEPNNSPGFDTREFLVSGPRYPIWHTLATWMAGVFGGFPAYQNVRADAGAKRAALSRVAVMNVKKVSGGATVSDSTLHRSAFQARDLLRRQLKVLEPELILTCGTFEQMVWLLEAEIPPGTDLNVPVVRTESGRHLVRFRHPARSRGVRDYNELLNLWSSVPSGTAHHLRPLP